MSLSPTTKILLVEDSDPDAETIVRLLRRAEGHRFEIDRVGTLSAALTFLRNNTDPQIILLDLSLPDSHHSVSAQSMLAHVPDIPIIVLTGNSDEAAAVDLVHQGAMDYLDKNDLNQQVLLRSIRYALERLRILQKLREANRELEMINADLETRITARTDQIREMEAAARQQQQQLAHADRLNLLGELATGLAHELNQPLMAIAAFSKSAQRRLPESELQLESVAELLKDISSEATRAGAIIQRLRQMIQRKEPQRSVVRIDKVINDTVEILRADLKAKSVQLQLPTDMNGDQVRADVVQFQQVIINLIHNAARAVKDLPLPQRRVQMDFQTDQGNAVITVRNLVAEAEVSTSDWFKPFFTTSEEGIGLGLPICQRIMKSLGGDLVAEAVGYNVGLSISIPLYRPSPAS